MFSYVSHMLMSSHHSTWLQCICMVDHHSDIPAPPPTPPPLQARREYLQKQEEDAIKAKKEQKQMFGDKMDALDKGLFGDEAPFSDDSSTTKSPEPFTGQGSPFC